MRGFSAAFGALGFASGRLGATRDGAFPFALGAFAGCAAAGTAVVDAAAAGTAIAGAVGDGAGGSSVVGAAAGATTGVTTPGSAYASTGQGHASATGRERICHPIANVKTPSGSPKQAASAYRLRLDNEVP